MSNSSQQQDYLTISDDVIKTALISAGATGLDTFSITLPSTSDLFIDSTTISNINLTSGGSGYTIASGAVGAGGTYSTYASDTITISGGDFNWGSPEEWVDSFPEWQRVEDMCQKYPALEIALRNFKTIYNLVKDDYDNPTPKK